MFEIIITSVILSFLFFISFYFGFKTSLVFIQTTTSKNNINENLPPFMNNLGGKKEEINKEEADKQKNYEKSIQNIVDYNPLNDLYSKKLKGGDR